MKKLMFLLGFGLLLFSCSDPAEEAATQENGEEGTEMKQNLPDNFEIRGKITGAVNQPLTLVRLAATSPPALSRRCVIDASRASRARISFRPEAGSSARPPSGGLPA